MDCSISLIVKLPQMQFNMVYCVGRGRNVDSEELLILFWEQRLYKLFMGERKYLFNLRLWMMKSGTYTKHMFQIRVRLVSKRGIKYIEPCNFYLISSSSSDSSTIITLWKSLPWATSIYVLERWSLRSQWLRTCAFVNRSYVKNQ